MTPLRLTGLRVATGTYLLVAVAAAVYAIPRGLRAEPFGIRLPFGIGPEFLIGWGTAISPGLPLCILLGALCVLTWRRSARRPAAAALGILGVLMVLGYGVERVVWTGFAGDPAVAAFALGGAVLAISMAVTARAATDGDPALTRRRTR